jgi:hypothetical protein
MPIACEGSDKFGQLDFHQQHLPKPQALSVSELQKFAQAQTWISGTGSIR